MIGPWIKQENSQKNFQLLAILDKAYEHLIYIEPSHGGTQFYLTVAGGKLVWADEFGLRLSENGGLMLSHIYSTPKWQV